MSKKKASTLTISSMLQKPQGDASTYSALARLNIFKGLPDPSNSSSSEWYWTEWGSWSSCSHTGGSDPSGIGHRTRERHCESKGVALNIDREPFPQECYEESNSKEKQTCRSVVIGGKQCLVFNILD